MLIPSIDLQDGKVVQLVQGSRLALEDANLDRWIDRFRSFPLVQVIDLDAAMGRGSNDRMLRQVIEALPCQVGGGIRSIERAASLLEAGAVRVIAGSAFFEDGGVNAERARLFAHALGADAVAAAVDCRGGHVVVRGWTESARVTVDDAIAQLEPHVGTFLCTLVETEGTLQGIDIAEIARLKALTTRRFVAAGGIRSRDEIDRLDALGVDAVVGMAIYTGLIPV